MNRGSDGDLVWSAPVDELRIGLSFERRTPTSPEVTLGFLNVGTAPRRIYFIRNPVFRSFQSSLYGTTTLGEIRALVPVSPPHGYVVGRDDFPLLEPHAPHLVTQTLGVEIGAGVHLSTLEWTYRNRIARWQPGLQTLDGETQRLFGDDEHPDLWVGEIEVGVRP